MVVANGNTPFQYTPGLNNNYYSNPSCAWSASISTDGQSRTNCLSLTSLPVLPAGLSELATSYKAPAVAQFSLGVQHELAPSVILVVQYVGNLAWHQNIERAIDTFPLNTPYLIRAQSAGRRSGLCQVRSESLTFGQRQQQPQSNPGLSNAYRTYQGYSGITQVENTTNGNYNGFQVGVRLANKWGLSGELDYTYSHEIDVSPNSTDLQTVDNPFNLKYDKAGGAFDRRQILQDNYIYKLPIFNHSTGLLHTALGGWEVAGTMIFETGVPFGAGFGGVPDPSCFGRRLHRSS